MNTQTIKVQLKTVYGKPLIYPICTAAHIFTSLIGRKTLTYTHLESIRALGYNIEWESMYQDVNINVGIVLTKGDI